MATSANFLLWGAFHGAALVLHRRHRDSWARLPTVVQWLGTMSVVTIGWIMFRVIDGEAMVDALVAIPTDLRFGAMAVAVAVALLPYVGLMVVIDIIDHRYVQAERDRPAPLVLAPLLAGLVLVSMLYGSEVGGEFIYFQF